MKTTILGLTTGYFWSKLGVLSEIFDFLTRKSHFLGGNDEKNMKICSFHPKKWGDFEKKRFSESINRSVLAKNSR